MAPSDLTKLSDMPAGFPRLAVDAVGNVTSVWAEVPDRRMVTFFFNRGSQLLAEQQPPIAWIEDELRALAEWASDLELGAFMAANDRAAAGWRRALSNKLHKAADQVSAGAHEAAFQLPGSRPCFLP